ncbi:hypothetical protein SAMN04487895_101193 [Paenibacillus sophorae]|uniref:Uncharacterized protein n=1 Tax=Paenibacillus sophorae TaxID=1333845 RepID=A0A1H8FQH9_9BACL|nr:hypothetical protein [Paenibacillus sophorae]QWU13936.1 hypothetical protein KP014_18525 [Paenibacillus sophorae]SEN33507.1 hypothetical protein SAMN04487895_101193 [Paenibacillus sophorae]
MEEHVQMLADWLNGHTGGTIVIEKQEMEDRDKVYFKLDRVDYRNADDVVDHYLDSALILHGTGSTMNADGDLVPLPLQSFEIAVTGLAFSSADEKRVQAQTERAKYTFTLE